MLCQLAVLEAYLQLLIYWRFVCLPWPSSLQLLRAQPHLWQAFGYLLFFSRAFSPWPHSRLPFAPAREPRFGVASWYAVARVLAVLLRRAQLARRWPRLRRMADLRSCGACWRELRRLPLHRQGHWRCACLALLDVCAAKWVVVADQKWTGALASRVTTNTRLETILAFRVQLSSIVSTFHSPSITPFTAASAS